MTTVADREIVNLDRVQEILADAVSETRRLNGSAVSDKTVTNKAEAAELNRRMLNLADQLELAAGLVRNEYWAGRGLISYDFD